MKRNRFYLLAATALMLAAAMNVQAAPQTTAFTYQGQLTDGGILPSGQTFQFTFTLYDAATNGGVIGTPIQQAILVASGGLFTTDLDFGQKFNGQQYWLEIKVGTTIANEQALAARQPISAVPVAQYALNSPTHFVFLSSASQATPTITPGNVTNQVAVLPLSGAVSAAYSTTLSGGILDLTPNGSASPPPPPQVLPVNGTFGSISAQVFVTNAFPAAGSTINVQAQLYTGNMFSGVMVPTPLTCVLVPSFSGFVAAGTSASCLLTGAAIPVAAGSSGVVVVSATSIGSPLVTSIPMTVSVGVGP
jgi:hypothetical protein